MAQDGIGVIYVKKMEKICLTRFWGSKGPKMPKMGYFVKILNLWICVLFLSINNAINR